MGGRTVVELDVKRNGGLKMRIGWSVRPSVCPSAWKNSPSTGQIFKIFHISVFSRKHVEKS